VPFMAVAFIIALTMKEKELKGRAAPSGGTSAAEDTATLTAVAH